MVVLVVAIAVDDAIAIARRSSWHPSPSPRPTAVIASSSTGNPSPLQVDKDDYVASTALTTSLLLVNRPGAVDTIGRWSSEVQAVLTSRGDMVQFHALALLRSIKRHDRLAVSKVVHTLMRSGMRSPLGLCLLIRYAVGLLEADASAVNGERARV